MKPVALAAAIAALAPASNALASVRRDHADIVHKIRMAAPEPEPNPAAVGEHLNTFQKRFGPGRMTFYDVGLGACGNWNTANEFVVALNSAQFGGYAVYPGPNCFKSIVIDYNGRQVGATIVDECPTCGYAELDLSRGLFAQFAPESAGVFYANWWFTDGSGAPPAPAPPPPPPPPAPTTTEAPPPPPPSTTEIIPPPSSTSSEDAPEQSAEAEQTETPPPNNLYTFGKVVVQLAGIIGHGAGPA